MVQEQIDQTEWVIKRSGVPDVKKPLPEDLGFIPVSYLAWEKLEAEPRGKPLGARLLKKIFNILSTLTDIRNANRNNSDGVHVIINADLDEGVIPRAGGRLTLNSRPGSTLVPDYKKVGLASGAQTEMLFKELEEQLRDLYEDAHLPFPGRDTVSAAPNPSGKAINILSAPQVAYRQVYLRTEQSMLEDLIYKLARIEGKKIERHQIMVQHDPLVPPDPQSLDDDARFYMDGGFVKEALRRKGVEEERLPLLLAERAEENQRKVDEFMLRAPLRGDPDEDEDDNKDPGKMPQPPVKGGPAKP